MLAETLDYVVDTLVAAGVPASTDPRNLTLPGVWVTPDTLTLDTLDGAAATVRVSLVIIGTGSGPAAAVVDLDRLLALVVDTLPVSSDWSAASIRLPNQSAEPLPALQGSIVLEWTP